MIVRDRRIAENTISDRQRLYGNTFQPSGNHQRSSAIIWKHFSAIGEGTAHLSKNRFAQSIWGLNFGQTKHEIACRDWNDW